MVDTTPVNGAYDLFLVNVDGSNEMPLTTTGWAQGLATFSNSGTELVYVVAAIAGQGKYRLHQMRVRQMASSLTASVGHPRA